MVEIHDLTRRFRGKIALNDVSLSIPSGVVFGLVGENGAGKTTLIKHILGLYRAQQGKVRVFGLDPVVDPAAVLSRIGFLSEDRDLPDWMRVGELMRYQSAFFPEWDDDFAGELLEQFELDTRQRVKSLSRGQRARIGLLLALAHRPDLLVLDEPSSGLDPRVRRDILSAIIRTVSDEGRTVVFSSHLLDEVERVADDIAMIREGRIVLQGNLQQLLQNHHRLVIRYPDSAESRQMLPGALSWSGEGREWTAVCNGQLDKLKQAATEAGGEIVEEERATLTDVFLARATNPAKLSV